MPTLSNLKHLTHYIHTAARKPVPIAILDEARKCLMDWTGVSLGAIGAPEAVKLAAVAAAWRSQGDAVVLSGGRAAPAVAALINGTLSHVLDFDDTHIPSILHGSGPIWAALLATGGQHGIDESQLLAAFAIGFQVGASIGMGGGIGVRLTQNGWHATPILGRFAATAALAAALKLDEPDIAHALGLAGTQATGLNCSFGSMAKPLHVGQAAMGSIMAIELAQAGFEGSSTLFEAPGGCLQTLLQDPALQLDLSGLDAGSPWELTRNSFKPYAACQLIHAALDTARQAYATGTARGVSRIRVLVHPLAARIAAVRNPETPTEGRFSIAYCIALGLSGYAAGADDFSVARLNDARLKALAGRIEVIADNDATRTSARLELEWPDGSARAFAVTDAFGSIGNPMQWPDLEAKFLTLAAPVVHKNALPLLQLLRAFGRAGDLKRLFELTQGNSI